VVKEKSIKMRDDIYKLKLFWIKGSYSGDYDFWDEEPCSHKIIRKF
jgi:hypothetical protein